MSSKKWQKLTAEWKKLHANVCELIGQFDPSGNPMQAEDVYKEILDSLPQYESILLKMYRTKQDRRTIETYEREYQHKECILNSLDFGIDADVRTTYLISFVVQPFL